jgi:hypothetical protein
MPIPTLPSHLWSPTLAVDLAQAAQPLGSWSPTTTAQPFLAAAFDAVRHEYASAVMAGLASRSVLASGQLERLLDTLESLMLGPLARRR